MFQYDKHTMHCVLGSVSSNSHNSMFQTSRIICFDSVLKGLNDWFCRRSRWRACWFGWFSIFWINSRTLALCACFTIERGSPGILKSMSASILSRTVSSLMLSVSASWYTSGSSCTATVSLPSRPDLSWVCSTMRLLLPSDEHAWTLITSCVIPGLPDLSEEQSSSLKKIHTDLLRTGRFFILNNDHVLRDTKSPWSITKWIWNWLGWLEEFCLSSNFSFWLSSNFPFWLSINFRIRFLCPIVTEWDLWWRSRWHVCFFI